MHSRVFVLQCLFISLGIDVRLFQENQDDSHVIESLILSKSLLSVSTHSGDTIEDDPITRLNDLHKPQPLLAIHSRPREDLLNDRRIRILSLDVPDLTLDHLFWLRDPTITMSTC